MLLDSNIVIYAARTQWDELVRLIGDPETVVSIVTYIEVLGFQRLDDNQKKFCENFFRTVTVLPLTGAIARRAVALRQQRRMGLGDAIIGATALEHDMTLATRNVRDFRWINGLELIDPLAGQTP